MSTVQDKATSVSMQFESLLSRFLLILSHKILAALLFVKECLVYIFQVLHRQMRRTVTAPYNSVNVCLLNPKAQKAERLH